MDTLKKRILEISFKKKLSHIGSCLTACDIIKEIFDTKKPNEKFVLSSGHAALALYVILESKGEKNAEEIFDHHGVHPDRCKDCGLDYSSGSLGHGIGAAVGMALVNRSKNVYCLISDGEMQEGSCYEALNVAHEQKLSNLKIYINCNGFGAYQSLEREHIVNRCRAFTNVNITFIQTDMNDYPEWLQAQQAHYHVMTQEEYEFITKT